jgi:hypothetical protein
LQSSLLATAQRRFPDAWTVSESGVRW